MKILLIVAAALVLLLLAAAAKFFVIAFVRKKEPDINDIDADVNSFLLP